MSVLYRGNNADDSAVDSLRRVSGGLRVSPHIAAVSGNKQDFCSSNWSRRKLQIETIRPCLDGAILLSYLAR